MEVLMRKSQALILLILLLGSNLAFAAGGGGHKASISSLGWYFFNFSLYLAVLIFLVRKPFLKSWAERSEKIEQHVFSAQHRLDDAKAKLAHAQAEAAALSQRIIALEQEISSATEMEKKKIVDDTAEQILFIERQTAQLIDAERQAQTQAVEREISARVISRAEEILKQEFVEQDDVNYRSRLAQNIKSLRGANA
jgi:F0F1-type ATP synthase membrane subunit b/b'